MDHLVTAMRLFKANTIVGWLEGSIGGFIETTPLCYKIREDKQRKRFCRETQEKMADARGRDLLWVLPNKIWEDGCRLMHFLCCLRRTIELFTPAQSMI
jgi:hypothetical protein